MKLEQLGGQMVSLLLLSLPLSLLFEFLPFLLSKLCRELLVSFFAELPLPRILLFKQLILNVSLAFQSLLVLLDSLLPLRCYLVRIVLYEGVFSLDQELDVIELTFGLLMLTRFLHLIDLSLSQLLVPVTRW